MKRLLPIFALAVFTSSVFPQGAPQTGIDAAIIKMFGETKAFTAPATVRLLDQDGKEVSTMPMTMALREGKLRTELDLSQVKMANMPAEAAAMMKQAGMDKMVTLIQPDKKSTAMIYPNAQSYAEMPSREDDAGGSLESKEMGDETIDGRACKKVKLTTVDAKGKVQEALVWQARELKNFPVQMEMKQKANTVVVKFQNPKLETPPASEFEIPAGYQKYPSFQALLQAAMLKMFSNGVPK